MEKRHRYFYLVAIETDDYYWIIMGLLQVFAALPISSLGHAEGPDMKRLKEILERIPDIERLLTLMLRCKSVTVCVEVDDEPETEGNTDESLQIGTEKRSDCS